MLIVCGTKNKCPKCKTRLYKEWAFEICANCGYVKQIYFIPQEKQKWVWKFVSVKI